MTISKELLQIIACPYCKSNLDHKENTLICTKCKKIYKIKDGIPILL